MKEAKKVVYLALRFLTLNITDCISWFLACSVTFWWFTDWITNGWAFWVVTLPSTLRMAFWFVDVLQFASENYYKQQGGDQYPHFKDYYYNLLRRLIK